MINYAGLNNVSCFSCTLFQCQSAVNEQNWETYLSLSLRWAYKRNYYYYWSSVYQSSFYEQQFRSVIAIRAYVI